MGFWSSLGEYNKFSDLINILKGRASALPFASISIYRGANSVSNFLTLLPSSENNGMP